VRGAGSVVVIFAVAFGSAAAVVFGFAVAEAVAFGFALADVLGFALAVVFGFGLAVVFGFALAVVFRFGVVALGFAFALALPSPASVARALPPSRERSARSPVGRVAGRLPRTPASSLLFALIDPPVYVSRPALAGETINDP
jgi:hypothetical protein